MSDKESSSLRPRWAWFVPVLVVGFGFVALAVVLQGPEAWPAILINLGTGALLAAVLIFLEPLLARRVARSVGGSVAKQVAEETERQVGAHFDNLQQLVTDLITQRERARDQAIDDLAHPTYETVTAAFVEAHSLQALFKDSLTVPVSDPVTEMRMTFTWSNRVRSRRNGGSPRSPLTITITGLTSVRKTPQTEWLPDESAEVVGARLVEILKQAGLWLPGRIDWGLTLRNLQHGLRIAVEHRTAESGEWATTAPMRELLTDDWIITDSGLESRSPARYIRKRTDFPTFSMPQLTSSTVVRAPQLGVMQGSGDVPDWPPPAPEGISPHIWRGFLHRALDRFHPSGWEALLVGLAAFIQIRANETNSLEPTTTIAPTEPQ